jgi:hypothetical protein
MKNFVKLLAVPFLAVPVIPSASHACISSVICATGQTNYASMFGVQRSPNTVEVAQYYPQQPMYQPPAFFQGSSGPVVVPPTVINPPGPRECRKRRTSFLLIFERETADC